MNMNYKRLNNLTLVIFATGAFLLLVSVSVIITRHYGITDKLIEFVYYLFTAGTFFYLVDNGINSRNKN